MRLTVGPLPPAVYWRRRAVVLGAGLLFLIVLLYSCTGSGRSGGQKPTAGGSPSATSAAPAGPDGPVLTPQTGVPSASTSADPGATNPAPAITSNTPPLGAAAGAEDDGTCTDEEISVVSSASSTSVQRGAVVELQLKIKNTSDRTCSRNVGADLQEIFIKSGAEKVWSSDTCGKVQGSDVQSFTPNFERSYRVPWNGRDTSRCDGALAGGPLAPIGSYQVFARVGTKHSEPAKLTVTG
ncbi:hypothetical protein EV382_4779 [Micromonospora violae]|uniref:Uncharacterized protein n=1 Tax=Micromonospora violae TaxID=1278207 RepID=A0A4Q7UNY1_9ACTN|nr:hypothetical protein [Micromonospora violae]RZT81499.1 hypothetical protein EV382_4779 [Micromonospora violae]